jgi:hypothetical protein
VKAKTKSSKTKIIISHSSGFLRKGQQLFAYILIESDFPPLLLLFDV